MKYVAFLDILGFKNRLRELEQNKAKKFISDFSGTIFSIFQSPNLKSEINGYIVSDSLILYSNDIERESLYDLIELIRDVCKTEFKQNGILMRGAIAKGEFDRVPAIELPKLEKQLIVGQAYVDAYLLEDSVKVVGINLSKEVYEDIVNMNITLDVVEEKIDKEIHYLFRYINSEFLLQKENLKQFIKLAMKSKWLPHYYNTIYFAIKNETNDNNIEQIFVNIEGLVCDNRPNEKWRELDTYIKNAFTNGVIDKFKIRFLKHIRKKLFSESMYDLLN
jgi:hypothetical protein